MQRMVMAGLICVLGLIGAVAPTPAQEGGTAGAGERFYYDTVLPRLAENGCTKCHAVGYLRPNVTVYADMLRRLAIGDSPTNNAIIYKIANLRSIAPDRPNHPGGQRCATVESEPCKTVMKWWSIEFAAAEQKP